MNIANIFKRFLVQIFTSKFRQNIRTYIRYRDDTKSLKIEISWKFFTDLHVMNIENTVTFLYVQRKISQHVLTPMATALRREVTIFDKSNPRTVKVSI